MKKIVPLLVAFLLLSSLIIPVNAVEGFISDEGTLLTDAQIELLDEHSAVVAAHHNFGVYVVTVDTVSGELRDYGYQIYRERGMGIGEDRAGVLLVHSAVEREYYMIFPTSEHKSIFTESGLDDLEISIVSYLRADDFYGAYDTFIAMIDDYLCAYEEGNPVGAEKIELEIPTLPDVAGGLDNFSWEQLIALKSAINMEQMKREEWQSVSVPHGVYRVGEDIPSGKWTIICTEGRSCYVEIGTKVKASGSSLDFSGLIDNAWIYNKNHKKYDTSEVSAFTIELHDGEYVLVDTMGAPATFTPFTGNSSLGFK